ncbi:hypothetical protein ACFWUQ_11590 [Streptomyces sp. NPDC058662]
MFLLAFAASAVLALAGFAATGGSDVGAPSMAVSHQVNGDIIWHGPAA